MSAEKIVQICEIDFDYCNNTFGVYPCGASLDALQSRTNLALWSEQINNAYWTKLQISVGVDIGLAPSGVYSADRILDTAVSSIHRISRSFTFTAGQPYTFSMFFTAEALSNVVMVFPAAPFTTSVRAQFDLAAGVVVGTPTGTPTGYGIEAVGGGWYRCWISKTATAGGAGAIEVRLNAGGADTYVGSGQGLYFWGAQVEIGATMSGYKPTTSATVTASHGGSQRKCYNTYQTCQFKQAYTKGTNTVKFIEASYPVKNGNYIPALVKVGGYEQEVNIAGFSDKIGGLGVRASVSVTLKDFPSRDTLTDKYFAGRMDGSAQIDEGPYDPLDRGSFWTKFKARVPNYAGRALRVMQAHYDASGALVVDKTRHYVMDELIGPDASGNVTIKAKDILSLADDKKALAPKSNQGRVLADMTAVQTTFTLTPSGIGDSEYDAFGWVTIGSEIMQFSRIGDAMTLFRAQKGTVAATHSANDTVQQAFSVSLQRADAVIYSLLVGYGNIPAAYITFSDWQAEFDRWGSSMLLSATICKPTGVSKLIAEINQLGITVWWDEVAQKIRIKLNHPPDTAPVEWSDRNQIMSITTEDNDDERATRVELYTVQIDPTKELNKDNFLRGYIYVSVDSESPNMFGLPRTQTILNRWMNHGDDASSKIITARLLNRYKRAPVTYMVKLDVKDDPTLTDVISLNSYVATDDTGKVTPRLTQVYYRADDVNGSTVTARLQSYQFDARYGVIAENSRPGYNASSTAQKLKGSYFVGPTLLFADGSGPYQFA